MLTSKELAWAKRVQKLLDNPPSDRLGFFTTGDCCVTIYDATKEAAINAAHDAGACEFAGAVDKCDAELGFLNFPNNVHSTAG